MITPRHCKSSQVVDGFPSTLQVVSVPIEVPEPLRNHVHQIEWQRSLALDGRRRAEYVAGRIAARRALAALIGVPLSRAVVDSDHDGSPVVRGMEDAPLVSISHARTSAVAVAGRVTSLGIDVCEHEVAFRVRRVVVRFVSEREVALADDRGVAGLTALWALKEAGAKALRRGLLDGGLRATCLAAIDVPQFAWPALEAAVVYRAADTIAIAYKP